MMIYKYYIWYIHIFILYIRYNSVKPYPDQFVNSKYAAIRALKITQNIRFLAHLI